MAAQKAVSGFWDPSSTAAAALIDDPAPIPRSAWLQEGDSRFNYLRQLQGEALSRPGNSSLWVCHGCYGYGFPKKQRIMILLGEFDLFITLLHIRTLYSFQKLQNA